jgi:hypothetical protein
MQGGRESCIRKSWSELNSGAPRLAMAFDLTLINFPMKLLKQLAMESGFSLPFQNYGETVCRPLTGTRGEVYVCMFLLLCSECVFLPISLPGSTPNPSLSSGFCSERHNVEETSCLKLQVMKILSLSLSFQSSTPSTYESQLLHFMWIDSKLLTDLCSSALTSLPFTRPQPLLQSKSVNPRTTKLRTRKEDSTSQ